MDNNVQDLCRVCRSEGSIDKPMYHPCICTGNIATIKRKPSFTPKIPLTSTTRNLAKQSDNALLDIKLSSGVDDGDEKLLRNGTLRLKRPSTHERLNGITMRESMTTPQQSNAQQKISPLDTVDNNDCLRRKKDNFVDDEDFEDFDDYPLPPPPETLTTSLSCLSLNSLPPPPSEFLDDAINNCSINYNNDLTTTYIRPTSITSSSVSCVNSIQSPNRRHSNAKPIASPVVPPKPHGLNGRIYESLNPLNNCDDTRSTNDTISISSCDSNSTSNISSVGTSSSDSNISSRYQMIRINPPTEIKTQNTSESQISLSSSSIHQNNIQSMTTQSNVTTSQSKSEYQFQPHPVRNNESNNHERTDEPIYQQIPAHIETNQTQPNIIYHQPQSNKSNQHLNQQFIQHHPHFQQSQLQQDQQKLQQQTHYQLPNNNHNNYNQKQDSIDGPIYQEVPKNLVHHPNHPINYEVNSNNTNNLSITSNNNRESTISQRSSNGSNLSLGSNNSSPVIIANNNNNNNNPLNLETRSSTITSTQTRNNNNNNIINHMNDCKTSTFNNKREIAASFNYPTPTRSPMRGPLPPPPELFLQDIHRVMDKKWKVSQQLSLDSGQTVNQLISGFRDPYDQMIQMIQMNEILCLDELLNQQQPLKTAPTSPYPPQQQTEHHAQSRPQQPQQPQKSQQPPLPPPNHYVTPPSINQNHHSQPQFNQQQQNYNHNYAQQQHHISPCQQIDELPEYGHHRFSSSSSSSHSTQFTNNNNMVITSLVHFNGANIVSQQQTNQDMPVPPPPPVLRCTNSSLFDKPLLRNKNGPPPPPRRSDKTRLSGRYQIRNETRNKSNH